jgi:hypothetical protein
MNTVMLEQTATHLTRQTSRWDRRLRLVTSLVWIPRGLMIGLLVGISVAVVSRLRPWLLPEQIAGIAGIALIVSGIGAAAAIWLWPRSTTHRARYFDRRFGLKERISTALELSGGVIPLPESLAERQLNDAVNTARKVNLAAHLPMRVYWREMLAVVALAGLLFYLLMTDNPFTDKLRSQRELENAISDQAAALEDAIQEIESNPALSAVEQAALTEPLQQALETLQQPNISQEEAIAALSEASQSLQELSDGMRPEQESAYQQAANELAGSDMTSDLADALEKADLGETADSMEDLADELGENELSEQERQDLADKLEKAAEKLEESNPALAQKLREAADALRRGDIEAAQKALREAAELARQQKEQLENSEMAQQAQQAQQQVQESQNQLAQAGQQNDSSQQAQASSGQQSQSQTGQQQPGQQSNSQPSQGQEGQSGSQVQPGESGTGQTLTESEGQNPQEGELAGEGESQGEGENGGATESGDQPGQDGSGSETSGPPEGAVQQQGGGGSGSGEGGPGSDNPAGVANQGGEIPSSNGGGSDGLQQYAEVFNPFNIGGNSDDVIDVGGESTGNEGEMVQEGEFTNNPEGESSLSYANVFNSYQDIVSDALESGRIPLDQRDVIHDYFSSLER